MGRKNPIAAVYCITNRVNGKLYFGESSNIVDRMSAYRTASRGRVGDTLSPIYQAIQDYGYDAFDFRIIVTEKENPMIADDDYRHDVELRYIRRYNTTDPNIGYNVQHTRFRARGPMVKTGVPTADSTKILKSTPILGYEIDTGDVFMYLGSKSASDILGFPKDGKAMIARCCKNGKSSHGHIFFYVDYEKRKKYTTKIIKEKSVSTDSIGRCVSPLRVKSLEEYIKAVKAVNRYCVNAGFQPVDLDEILHD